MNIFKNVNWVWTVKKRTLVVLSFLNVYINLLAGWWKGNDFYDYSKGGLDALERAQTILINIHRLDNYTYNYDSVLNDINGSSWAIIISGAVSCLFCFSILFLVWQISTAVEAKANGNGRQIKNGKFIFNKVEL